MNQRDATRLKKYLIQAQRLCSRQEKCISDLMIKLRKWEISNNDAKIIIHSLVNDGFIDEKRFAKLFANEKARLNKWGPIKIRMALRSKGICENDIDLALDEVSKTQTDETLTSILSRKASSFKYSSIQDLKGKLIRFGVSRGFELGEVIEVINEIVNHLLQNTKES